MLADAVDGLLSTEEQAAFDRHLLGCTACRETLADAKRGAAWMEMLRQHSPEPPAAMLERILAQTTGAQGSVNSAIAGTGASGAEGDLVGMPGGVVGSLPGASAAVSTSAVGVSAASKVLPFPTRLLGRFDLRGVGHTLLQPRLAMTAAMAFFSIALTLNLTGVRLSELRASDLKPSSLKRSMYEANAHVVRYYTNLRVVYELESRVRDLQRSSDNDTPAAPAAGSPTEDGKAGRTATDPASKSKEPGSQPKRRVSPGTSRREPMREDRRVVASTKEQTYAVSGLKTLAMLSPDAGFHPQEGVGL